MDILVYKLYLHKETQQLKNKEMRREKGGKEKKWGYTLNHKYADLNSNIFDKLCFKQ